MADRFPSLDEFDAGPTQKPGPSSQDATDSPSNFLAREKAALGDDANLFSTPADAATVEDGDDDDLLGGGGSSYPASQIPQHGQIGSTDADDDMGAFETSFPAVDTSNTSVGPSGAITGSTLPFMPAGQSADAAHDDETAVLRDWREQRNAQLRKRDEVSSGRKAETVGAAQEAVDEFYENYNNKKDKGLAQTKREAEEFLQNREDTTAGGTSWERIAKLVDLSGKGASGGASGTGKAKMRDLLLSLRKDEKAPGATGY